MSSFKKLLLVSALTALASPVFAMESMDDSAMSEATGQDGIDIFTTLNISGATLTYTDTNGFASTPSYANSGDLKVNGLGVTGTVKMSVDVGATAAGPEAALLLGINGTSALNISLTSITVNKTGGATNYDILTLPVGTTITVASGYNLNLELGKGPSGHLGVLTGNIGTITVGDNATPTQKVALTDSSNSGTIGFSRVQLTGIDLGGGSGNQTNIDVCDGTAVTANCAAGAPGLKVTFAGTAMATVGANINDIRLGSATGPVVGQVAITGLNLSGTSMRIVGH